MSSIGGHTGIRVVNDVDSVDDLPDPAEIDSEAVWYLESGDLAPDYVGPTMWDDIDEQFTEWVSLVDGEILSAIPDSDPNHWWPADEGAGSSLTDGVGSIDVSLTFDDWESGTYIGNSAPKWNGVDSMGTADGASIQSLGTQATIAFTYRADSISGRSGLVGNYDDSSRYGIIIEDSTEYRGYIGGESTSSAFSSADVPSGENVRLQLVYDDDTLTVYENGSDVGSAHDPDGEVDFAGDLYFGAWHDGDWVLDGILDDIQLDNEAWDSSTRQDDLERQPWW